MRINIECRKCSDEWLTRTEAGEKLPQPEYVESPDHAFDSSVTYRCSMCGHLLTMEVV